MAMQDISSSAAKVGIFMPCYNLGEYIQEGLKSLYDQTFTDFIVIVADDASPQKKSVEKLAKIDYPRCKVVYEKKNLGLVKLSNKHMEELDAEYILLLSPEDKLHPDFLKEQVTYLDQHPDVAAVCTWIQEFGDSNKVLQYSDDKCILPDMLVTNNFSGAAVIRKSAWLAVGKNDTNPNLHPYLDYALWLSMLDKGFKLATIPKPYYYWRVLHSSMSHGVSAQRVLTFRKAIFEKYGHLYKKYYDYTTNYYLERIGEFEEYYALSEEGHDWLDKQYKSLSKENATLNSKLDDSIQRPYLKSAYHKAKTRLTRP